MQATGPIEQAFAAYRSELHLSPSKRRSICQIARDFDVHSSTLSYRINRVHAPQSEAHVHRQALSPAEAGVLVDWIRRTALVGFPASVDLVRQVAELLRKNRLYMTISPSNPIRPLGRNWVSKFKQRHPDIRSTWSKALEAKRVDGCSEPLLQKWFIELHSILTRNQYHPSNIYNMDETGYSLGSSLSQQVLTHVDVRGDGRLKRNKDNIQLGKAYKKDAGRQGWVTVLECVSASGRALPPFVIMKGKGKFNQRWLPEDVELDGWQFWTSTNGWTNNYLGTQWLYNTFDHYTRPPDPNQRRLLIIDGHGSHVTATFISYCLEHAIDVMVLPPHSSHITQPLDVGVFGPLKRAMDRETSVAALFNQNRIEKAAWIVQLAIARSKAFIPVNVSTGWRNTGIHPFNERAVLKLQGRVRPETPPRDTQPPYHDPLITASTETQRFLREIDPNIRTPTKNRLVSLSSSNDSLSSQLTLSQKTIEELQASKKPVKRKRDGNTVTNLGTHEFTGDIGYRGIVEGEARRKAKKQATEPVASSSGSQRLTEASLVAFHHQTNDTHA